jgi:Family of unknown function (DUF6114)
VIDYRAGSGRPRVQQRPPLASVGDWIERTLHAFRDWRGTRPFWGGLLVIAGASEMLWSEDAPLRVVVHAGMRGLAGYLTPVFLLLCGALLWWSSTARTYNSLLAIGLASYSWVTSNLGGFFIGMLISVVGGVLAFSWMTDADYESSESSRGGPQMRPPSWAVVVASRLREHRARLQKRRLRIDSVHLAEPKALPPLVQRAGSGVTVMISRLRERRGASRRLLTRPVRLVRERRARSRAVRSPEAEESGPSP